MSGEVGKKKVKSGREAMDILTQRQVCMDWRKKVQRELTDLRSVSCVNLWTKLKVWRKMRKEPVAGLNERGGA